MKSWTYFFGIILLSFFWIGIDNGTQANSGAFDNNEENWRRMFRDIKKINSRLVTLETGKMQALENTQRDLFRQIDEIKSLIPNLQGSVEQSQADVSGRFEATHRKLEDIENQINSGDKLNSISIKIDDLSNQLKAIDERLSVF